MKKLRWFITRNLVRLANKTIPDDDCLCVIEVTHVDDEIERSVCNKIREKLQQLRNSTT